MAILVLLPLASPGDIVQLHLDNTTNLFFIGRMGGTHSVQEKPIVVVSSHPKNAHNPPSSVAHLRGEQKGQFSQETQSKEVGLQTS